jgi:hypothetical protein
MHQLTQSKQKRRKRVRLRLRAYVLSEEIYKMKLFYKGRRLLGELVPAHLL